LRNEKTADVVTGGDSFWLPDVYPSKCPYRKRWVQIQNFKDKTRAKGYKTMLLKAYKCRNLHQSFITDKK